MKNILRFIKNIALYIFDEYITTIAVSFSVIAFTVLVTLITYIAFHNAAQTITLPVTEWYCTETKPDTTECVTYHRN